MSNKNPDDEEVSLNNADLEELRRSLRAIVDIRDRQMRRNTKQTDGTEGWA